MKFPLVATTVLASSVAAQDPAEGWMAYARGNITDTGAERVTRLEMSWKVGALPVKSSAFFSPWFGLDPDDNLNLIQPVNPYSGSRLKQGSWSAYTEYYQVRRFEPSKSFTFLTPSIRSAPLRSAQWKPTHNSNSDTFDVEPGQTLHGSLIYNPTDDSYDLTQTCVETGATSTQNVPCQSGKKYTIPYVVYEKVFPCADYPPDGIVSFFDIIAECDGKDCVSDIVWANEVKDDNCEMATVVHDDQKTIDITWNVKAKSKYDDWTREELHSFNLNNGGENNWAHALFA